MQFGTPENMSIRGGGLPPIRAKRLKYYERPDLNARANLPRLSLHPGGPYPFRPRQHPNPWAGRGSGLPPTGDGEPPAPVHVPTNPVKPAPTSSSASAGPSIPLAGQVVEVMGDADVVIVAPDPADAAIQEQLDLLTSEEEIQRRQALDELERLHHRQHHGVRHHIPL
jgi:hypothetical protein